MHPTPLNEIEHYSDTHTQHDLRMREAVFSTHLDRYLASSGGASALVPRHSEGDCDQAAT
jgi:hypothetical protein